MNQQVATIQPSRMPIPAAVAKEFEIQPAEWRVLVEQIFPAAKSVESVMMALAYCRKRNLDIFKKPVHIVPMWSSAKSQMVETVWPGIAEIRTTASRTGEYAGIDAVEFGPIVERSFTGTVGRRQGAEEITKKVRYPEWASVVVYRMVHGARCAYHAKVFWDETYATIGKGEVPNEMWAKRPRGQLDKCVEAAALRKAFPEELGNTYAAEEMEGRTIDGEVGPTVSSSPTPPPAPRAAPPKPSTAKPPAEVINQDTGEITDIEDDPALPTAAEGDEAKRLDPEISASLKTGLLKRLATCKTQEQIAEWAKRAVPALPTLQEDDRAELQMEWDARSAEIFEKEQSADG